MSDSTHQKRGHSDAITGITDALEALDVATLPDDQLRRLHAALTYMHELLALETERRGVNDESGDTVRVASPQIETT
jgi:hypothetical protein